jgi:hypothetical protein
MSNFFGNVYKLDRKLARILIVLTFIQLVLCIVRVQITPFYVYSMFSWHEAKTCSDTMSFTFVRIGDKRFPNINPLQLRMNNDFLPDVVYKYLHKSQALNDSAVDAKFRRRIPKLITENTPSYLRVFYREHVPTILNELNSSNTQAGMQKSPKWLSEYIQEKENNYKDSVYVYKLKVRLHDGKFDTLSEKRLF